MKKYEKSAHIAHTDGTKFNKYLSERIDEYQRSGLQVEVQYRTGFPGTFTALILAYKEVQ